MAPEKTDFKIYNVVIGTAGHIDHGKSSVIRRLTGIDPDRLPEEKSREMTIDIGFANFPLKSGERVGIIDVPGHEDFIKNMLAGATGIDIVMLVISARESVMPQTIEHLHIMDLLGLKRGLIVINKIDLADSDDVELVAEEIKERVAGTFLDGAPIMKVSAETGEGVEELYAMIDQLVHETPPREISGVFRLPIQRVFTKKGFGTVITGVPVSGSAKKGDILELLPIGRECRIKSMQAYGQPVDGIRAGHSSALNVSDIEHSALHRGDIAATPGYFKASSFLEARFKFLPDTSTYIPEALKVLKSFMPIKFHCGTKETEGKIVILDKPKMQPGDEGYVQLRLNEPVVVAEGDPFIIRIATPTYTIGGGRIVDLSGEKLKRFREKTVGRLEEKDLTIEDREKFIEFQLKDMGFRYVDLKQVTVASKLPEEIVARAIDRLKEQGALAPAPKGPKFMHRDTLGRAAVAIREHVARFHEKNPMRAGLEKLALKQQIKMDDAVFEAALKRAVGDNKIAVEYEKVRLANYRPKMSREEGEIAAELERIYAGAGLASPRLEEVFGQLNRWPRPKIKRVAEMLGDQGVLALLKDNVILHQSVLEDCRKKIVAALTEQGGMEPAALRNLLGTTRKYLIPLMEHMDAIGVTKRIGNKRELRAPKK